ncbi:ParB/RepB/Spo0J family partition protein [Sphingomonas sp. PAMC 26605]|uniref:ParB/RepB/Spo0J family partition protein n=1 Tax=Sphingomonas sp. PAMC 26605 TaxID=1112214 RepID=UPI00026CAC30|nr:ParB/RepB/Spo0J family partition protein [Sphingomonas sp. PAMC 26605]
MTSIAELTQDFVNPQKGGLLADRRTMTIGQLELSPFNVRTNAEDTSPNDAMEKSILAFGLIHALRVHPMKGRKNKWGVHAGGRRYRAIKALIGRGDLPGDWPIDVVIREASDADLQAESAAENILRRELRSYEIFQGVAKSHRRGDSPEKIAAICGQEVITIRKWIRLGNLAKPVFNALEAGAITEEQAKAYAATEDHALQIDAFEHLHKLHDWDKAPAKIRAYLRVSDVETTRLLRFVGADAYTAAGGALELDLFSDGADERARIKHEDLLRQLAFDKLAGVQESTRQRTGRPDLRFVAQPPQASHGGPDLFLGVSAKVLSRDMLGNPDRLELPDGDIVAFIRIAEGGEPDVSYWWETSKAKYGSKKDRPGTSAATFPPRSASLSAPGAAIGGMVAYGAKPLADAEIKQESGLTQEGIEIFRSIRTTILRGALIENAEASAPGGDAATDYLVWAQLRILVKGDMAHLVGVRGLTSAERGPDSARDHIGATEASRRFALALHELQQQSFLTCEDLAEAYLDYRASASHLKRMAAAVVTGMALQRSLGGSTYRLPIHDAVAADLDLLDDERIRTFWRPTGAMLDLLPKSDRLAIAEPFVETASFAPWSRQKSSEITTLVLQVVTGAAATVRASMADAAARWVHPLLRFAPIAPSPAETLEAAE